MKITRRRYEAIDFPPLTAEQLAEVEQIKNLPDEKIDLSDIPECKGNGGFYYAQSLKIPKTTICTKIDNDTLKWLKKGGKGYQTRLNDVLRWARENNCPCV